MFCTKQSNHISIWLCHPVDLPAMDKSSCCSIALHIFGFVSVLDFDLFNRCVIVSHCFNLQSLNDTRIYYLFMFFVISVFLTRSLFRSYAHLLIRLFCLYWALRALCIFGKYSFIRRVFCKCFPPNNLSLFLILSYFPDEFSAVFHSIEILKCHSLPRNCTFPPSISHTIVSVLN